LKAWDAAIERAKANLAHQLLRNTNADLQLRHASNAHKVHLTANYRASMADDGN
jgi:hypothetical protein